jgi:hypothetical protein
MWLPVTSDVALGVGRDARTEVFVLLTNSASARHLNEAIVRQSTMFAARSEALVRSLRRVDRVQQTIGIGPFLHARESQPEAELLLVAPLPIMTFYCASDKRL